MSEFTKIPREMRESKLWSCWKYRANPDGGKPSKIPYNPTTGRMAKINDPDTLCTFEEAVEGVQSGKYDGVNYAFGY